LALLEEFKELFDSGDRHLLCASREKGAPKGTVPFSRLSPRKSGQFP
jgi:hypothetical protein